MAGSLVVVGTGIRALAQITRETRAAVVNAERVFYGVGDPLTEQWIRSVQPGAESLDTLYRDGQPRRITYQQMIDRILGAVREGSRVCVCLEGHPGVLVHASHASIRAARAEGFEAQMLPGISTMDSLFSDLGIDPAEHGLQTFDATDFLLCDRVIDAATPLVLWQVDCLGDATFRTGGYPRKHLPLLSEALQKIYGADHEIYLYQAAVLPISRAIIERATIATLAETALRGFTLYVPAGAERAPDPEAMRSLGMCGGTPWQT
jgi:precorrin-6B methylase 1